jgi:hypothetical protein
MKLNLQIGNKSYTVDLIEPVDISLPITFDEDSAAAFGAAPAQKAVFEAGDFAGSVRAGGSCNCELYTFAPHLHGTHTECVGHISDEPIAVTRIIGNTLLPATLVTIAPEIAAESYDPALNPNDMTITQTALEDALEDADPDFLAALIVRTNSHDLDDPPFFSTEAMTHICRLPIEHLLTDLPSVDRRDDGGKLSNHRIFWGVMPGVTAIETPSSRTITEMIRAPKTLPDGRYLLDLQVAPFVCDAAPSRPVLYSLREA